MNGSLSLADHSRERHLVDQYTMRVQGAPEPALIVLPLTAIRLFERCAIEVHVCGASRHQGPGVLHAPRKTPIKARASCGSALSGRNRLLARRRRTTLLPQRILATWLTQAAALH